MIGDARDGPPFMTFVLRRRTKKLLGIFFIVGLVLVYSLIAVTLAGTIADAHWSVHLAFFFFSGLGWVLPAMLIIRWMETDSGRG